MYPTELKYTHEHEWIRPTGEEAAIGITDFAQKQLGDVVFVELPEVGRTLAKNEVFGTIESVKAVSELFSPVSGTVVAINEELGGHPDYVNGKPHDTWMIRVRMSDAGELDGLMNADAYEKLIK
jgi:glycine cleavage system H protein